MDSGLASYLPTTLQRNDSQTRFTRKNEFAITHLDASKRIVRNEEIAIEVGIVHQR